MTSPAPAEPRTPDFEEMRREMDERVAAYFEAWFAREVHRIVEEVRRPYTFKDSATHSEFSWESRP